MAWLLLILLFGGGYTDDLQAGKEAVRAGEYARAIDLLTAYLETENVSVEAHYWRGIAFRERGKHPTLRNKIQRILQRGAHDFEFVLAQDSAYQDVLYQYALLKRYQGDLREAIRLGEAQLRHRTDFDHVLPGVLSLYWRYLVESSPGKARQWLREQSGLLTTVFIGKAYERQGFYDAAESHYTQVLDNAGDDIDLVSIPVRLALARLDFAQKYPEAGTGGVLAAFEGIQSRMDAMVCFEEIKTIASPAEVAAFKEIQDIVDYRTFFDVFWASRDPMPAAPYNARMVEHYRRLRVAEQDFLFYGYRSWYRSAFTHEASFFPETYALSQDFNDRGIIYIRHGEPDEYTVGEANSWLYRDSLMVFHFAPTCTGGICSVTSHFVPSPEGPTFPPNIVGLDNLDAEHRTGGYLMQGLSSDRHQWPSETRHWDVHYVVAAFRGWENRALVEVYYRVPVDEATRTGREDSIMVEVGFTAHDELWRRLNYVRERQKHSANAGAYVDRFQVDLEPKTHHLSLHARVLDGVHLAAHRFKYTPSRFDGPGLKVSDVLLADSIDVLPDVQDREDYTLHVNPAGTFKSSTPVHVYFEVYDLQHAPDGQTRYRVSYGLIPEKEGRDGAITLQTDEQRSVEFSPIEYVVIDLSDIPRGLYILEVMVSDEVSGQEAVGARSLEIVRG